MTSAVDAAAAVRLSLEAGLWCALLGFLPAVALGWVFARKDFAGKSLAGTLLLAPLVLPPVVTGLLLLKILGTSHPLGAWLAARGWAVPFSFLGAVLASLTVSLPLYVLAARAAFENVDRRYEELAWSLGLTPFKAFLRVTLPLAMPGVAAGAVLVFARALGEFGATIVLAGNVAGRTQTIALAVYTLLDSPGGDARMSGLLWTSLAFAFAALAGYELLVRAQKRRVEVGHA